MEAETPNLTDQDKIKENKIAIKLRQAQYNMAKNRSEELYATYETMLEEKEAREEEQKFQDQIDAKYDEIDEIYPYLDQMHLAMDRLWTEWDLMPTEEWDAEKVDAEWQKHLATVNALEG